MRRSRFRGLIGRDRRQEGLACSRLASTRVTNSSNSETNNKTANQRHEKPDSQPHSTPK